MLEALSKSNKSIGELENTLEISFLLQKGWESLRANEQLLENT